MTFHTRRRFLAGSVAAAASTGILRFPANAAEFNFKFASESKPEHHNVVRLKEAAKAILDQSGGRIDIQVFPSGQLGGPSEILSQVRLGAVQFTSSLDTFLGNLTPVAAISNTPYVFSSAKAGLAAMAGPLGVYRRNAIAKLGLHPFEVSWDQDFRQLLCTTRSIRTPDDVKGLKVLTSGPVEVLLFKAFGASPLQVPINEIYTSLQTRLADATSSPFAGIHDFHFYEAAKFLSTTNHIWTATSMLMNADVLASLPRNLQDLIIRNINQAADRSNADAAALHGQLEDELVKLGTTVTHPDNELFKSFLNRTGFYSGLRDLYGPDPWKLLESAVGRGLA